MAGKSMHIFIVDDDEMLTTMLSDHLSQNENFKISAFQTGEDCIENLHQQPDVIILDYYLNSVDPDAEDGLSILEKIKKQDKQAFVIFLSAQNNYSTALQSIAKGAFEYVMKDEQSFSKIDSILESLS